VFMEIPQIPKYWKIKKIRARLICGRASKN
jgi:hypothetical protein